MQWVLHLLQNFLMITSPLLFISEMAQHHLMIFILDLILLVFIKPLQFSFVKTINGLSLQIFQIKLLLMELQLKPKPMVSMVLLLMVTIFLLSIWLPSLLWKKLVQEKALLLSKRKPIDFLLILLLTMVHDTKIKPSTMTGCLKIQLPDFVNTSKILVYGIVILNKKFNKKPSARLLKQLLRQNLLLCLA